jgi:hypothetical protein
MGHGFTKQGLGAAFTNAAYAATWLLSLTACELRPIDEQPLDAAVEAAFDAADDVCVRPSCDAAVRDGGVEAQVFDADLPDSDPDAPPFASLTMLDGEQATGEWVATYNHNYWWDDAGAELTFALFDIHQLDQYPEDRSFRFIPSHQVQNIELLPWPSGQLTFRDALRLYDLSLGSVIPGVVHVITANDSYHLEEDGFGDFAFDLVLTDEDGSRFTGDGTQNEDFMVWNADVTCPVTGIVVELERDLEDNDPGGFAPNAPANRIGISVNGSFYVYLYHFRKGSIPDSIDVGSTLFEGEPIGQVGNSGMSEEPHLHVAMLWYDETAEEPRSWGVPVEFRDVEVAATPTGPFVPHEYFAPRARSWIRSRNGP